MKNNIKHVDKGFNPFYWACQAIGWGSMALLKLFHSDANKVIETGPDNRDVVWFLSWVMLSLIITHLMRMVIRGLRLLEKEPRVQAISIFFLTIAFTIVHVMLTARSFHFFGDYRMSPEKRLEMDIWIVQNIISVFIILFTWNSIYFLYHYMSRAKWQLADSNRMIGELRSMELKNIRSHISPHFLFNSLNGIRGLVDEDPGRARASITSLSNILMNSLQVENVDVVPLQKELEVVRDYMSLQRIRFGDWLKLEYAIDPRTLQLPVPNMMLQTLIENAVKHGIQSKVGDCPIRIESRIEGRRFEISVNNCGRLEEVVGLKGFGLSSTRERLELLFGDTASFSIRQKNDHMVEALVVMTVVE
jgi:two-component system LytT family sensor kinase